jgi:hypothetical protein
MQYLNDPYPWTDGREQEYSLVDLVMNETIPAGPAALLWWALERGASLLTAGGPSGAGKSTLANACLPFLPDGAHVYVVAGREDPLLVPADGGPTYLLISELSQHGRPHYLSGPAARRAFALVRAGLRVVGTLHAESVDEAITNLGDEVELTPADIARVDLIAIVHVEGSLVRTGRGRRGRVQPDDAAVRRRVVEIGLLGPEANGGVHRVDLAAWRTESGQLAIVDPPAGINALADWAGVPTPTAAAAIAARADILARLAADGRRDPRDVAEAARLLRTT